MSNYFNKVKKFCKFIGGFWPTAVPVGMTAFDDWAQSIMDIYPLPTSDKNSVKYSLATMIMHRGPLTAYWPKFWFFLAFRSAAAKQIAGAVFQEIKLKQQADHEAAKKAAAEAAAKPAEVTATLVADGPKV